MKKRINKFVQTAGFWDADGVHQAVPIGYAVVRDFRFCRPWIWGKRADAREVYVNTRKIDPKRVGMARPHYIWEKVKKEK